MFCSNFAESSKKSKFLRFRQSLLRRFCVLSILNYPQFMIETISSILNGFQRLFRLLGSNSYAYFSYNHKKSRQGAHFVKNYEKLILRDFIDIQQTILMFRQISIYHPSKRYIYIKNSNSFQLLFFTPELSRGSCLVLISTENHKSQDTFL